jgi:aminocarboxymuconate-semialdehyde decarboxylase
VKIDCHAHVIPFDYPADSPACFPSMEPIPGESARTLVTSTLRFKARDVFFDAERRLEAMDVVGVDVEVVSPMPPLLNYRDDAADVLALSRHVNEFVLSLTREAPGRILGFGMVPLQDPELASKELAAIKESGLLGVEIAANVNGTSLGDDSLFDFFAECQSLDLPVFVHAMSPAFGPRLPASATATYGFTIEASLAAASLLTCGVLERLPDLRVSISHGAGGFPLMLPRDQWFYSGVWNEGERGPERTAQAPDAVSPSVLARRLYYDGLVFDRRALRYLIDMVGRDRVLLGSDFPAMDRESPGDATLASMDLPADVHADITCHNALRFLGLSDDQLTPRP